MFEMNTMHNAVHPPYVTHDCALVSLLKGLDLGPTGIDLTIGEFIYNIDQQVIDYYLQSLVRGRFRLR